MSSSDPARVRVAPGSPPAHWQLRVPGSKSLTNRALLLSGVADGRSRLAAPLIADDTEAMAGALRALGATVAFGQGGDGPVCDVDGIGGAPRGPADVQCAMAGTVGRFIVPMLAAGHGRFTVDGHPQLRRRPLGPVLAALRAQGAEIDGESLPLTVAAHGLAGGGVDVDTTVSSQFLSGLLMASRFAAAASTLRFGALVSAPYLALTIEMMRSFGVDVARGNGELSVAPGGYRATDLAIEPDVSTASYFLASAALTATTVTLPGLDLDATGQGDIELVSHLVAMGCEVVAASPLTLRGPPRLRGVHVHMGDSSDVFMTLACVAPFADGPTTIEGIGHARVKESDRIGATAENLRRLGVRVEEGPDVLRIHPGTPESMALPTYDDHRIAMAFALIGTHVPVEIQDADVVAKTCPEFFSLWRATGADVETVA
jgi:3-phosphoshikimate 1-carboxyvinyltransferase